MRIYGKNGIIEITLRPFDAPMQGTCSFHDHSVGISMDVNFTAYDGKKRYIVMGWSDQNPDIVFHGKAFHFVLEPVEDQCISKEVKCPRK